MTARLSQDDLVVLHLEAVALAASAFGVSRRALRRSRSRKACFARHVAIYLVRMQVSIERTRNLFRLGSNQTVSHALRQVEDARDDDAIDAKLEALELALQRRLKKGEGSHGLEMPNQV